MTDQINDGMKLSMVGAIPVTPDMIAAGRYLLETRSYGENHDALVADFYSAMAALAPVELVTTGELAALKERDAAFTMRNEVMAALEVMAPALNEATARNLTLRDAFDRAEAEFAALQHDLAHRFTLFEVKALLAAHPAPVPETPKPAVNPFRESRDDRRRVGGLTA